MDFMFISTLFCKATCLLRPIFVEHFSGRSKQVLFGNFVMDLLLTFPEESYCTSDTFAKNVKRISTDNLDKDDQCKVF